MKTWDGYREPFAEEALQLNRRLVEGRRVRLEMDKSDTDIHGRLLRYVYVGRVFVNAEMVRAGLASALYIPPNTRHAALFARLEDTARQARIGMWK